MNQLGRLLAILILLLPMNLKAENSGSLSVFVFLDGKPLADIEVVIDGNTAYRTDSDGSIKIILENGKHKVEIIGKNERKQNLGYIRRTIEIKNEKDTQLAAQFQSGDDDLITIETPLEGREAKVDKSIGTAFLQGTVLSSESNQPVMNARILVKGTSVDVRTNEDGYFRMAVPANVWLSLTIIHSEYNSLTLHNIYLMKNEYDAKEFKLTTASIELEEFIVLAPKVKGSIASIVAEEKASHSISNYLSSEEFGKKGDSSAAEALKRVTGVTLIDSKSVYVRGLGDRYSNIEMNSMPLPSPNPLKRTVPMDIFPAGAVSSMKVQKSASADIPSNMGGGYIDLRTKDSSDDDYFKVAVGVKANTNTGNSINSYQGGDTDIFGFDDGYREINSDILQNSQVIEGERINGFTTDYFTEEELSQFTQDFVNRNYNVTNKDQPLGFGVGVEGNKSIKFNEKNQVSLFGYYKYKNDSKSNTETYNNYDMQKSTGELYPDPSQTGTIDSSTLEYAHNALVNLGYNYADAFRIKYTLLYTHDAEADTIVADGIMGSNNENMTKYYLNWEERSLIVNQINGDFDYQLFGNETNFRFGLEMANAGLYQPNNYQYTYRNEGDPFLDNKVSNNIATNLDSTDDLMAYYVKNKFHFNALSEEDYLDIGLSMSSKERESRQNKFFLNKQGAGTIVNDSDMTGTIEDIYDEYVRPDIPYDERPLVVSQLFQPADHYDAEVDETNVYVNTFFKPLKKVELLLGARYVDFSQVVYQYEEDRNNPDMSKRRLIVRVPEELAVNGVYPSLGAKYSPNEKNIFDIAFSKTYIAPDLREFTSGEYYHPYEVATIVGNPDLENTDIYSVDLKYSYYFSDIENIKFGLFYKYLDKPIEDVMLPTSSLPIYSFDNADNANLYGLEIDGRKNFSFIHPNFKNYYISGNISITDSKVVLGEDQESIYSTNNRQLQGLSPVVINLTFGYDSPRRSVALSYNKMGERIRKVGMIDDGNYYPDHYEDPAALLDFVWIEKFKKGFDLSMKLGNILQDETVWTQGGRVTKRYKNPMTFSVELSYKF